MATITNAQVTAALALLDQDWFGAFDNIGGVTNDVTTDAEDFTFDTVDDVEVTMTYLELVDIPVAQQIIIGAVVDDLIGDITSGDYGPWTRVTADSAMPHEDKNVPKINLQTANDNDVWMTYEQLTRAQLITKHAQVAEGINHKAATLVTAIDAIKTAYDEYSTPYTEANYKAIINGLLAIEEIKGHF
jgi:hypothetical protein